jgi:hypothetical protein
MARFTRTFTFSAEMLPGEFTGFVEAFGSEAPDYETEFRRDIFAHSYEKISFKKAYDEWRLRQINIFVNHCTCGRQPRDAKYHEKSELKSALSPSDTKFLVCYQLKNLHSRSRIVIGRCCVDKKLFCKTPAKLAWMRLMAVYGDELDDNEYDKHTVARLDLVALNRLVADATSLRRTYRRLPPKNRDVLRMFSLCASLQPNESCRLPTELIRIIVVYIIRIWFEF